MRTLRRLFLFLLVCCLALPAVAQEEESALEAADTNVVVEITETNGVDETADTNALLEVEFKVLLPNLKDFPFC